MDYKAAVKEACRQAVKANEDRFVFQHLDGTFEIINVGNIACVYCAEPSYESAIIGMVQA